VEQGVSGSKPWRERELGRAVEACQRGEATGIVVAFQDRLSRESGLGTAEVWEALDKAGARLVASSEGLDTATGDHEMLFSIKAAIAREQWKRHRLNWTNAKHASWERGQYVAPTPAGFDRAADGGIVRNEHAPAIRRAFELRAARPRASWSEVAGVFENAGIKTRFGKAEWSKGAIRSVVANQVYTGRHACTCGCGESAIRSDWEVVPGWLWRKAQSEGASEESKSRVRGDGYPLGLGLCRCGTCGAGLTRSAGKRSTILRCQGRGVGHAAILYAPALEWILLEAARYIGIVKLDDGNDAERAGAEQAVADARAALAEVEEMLGTQAPAGSKQRVALQEAEDRLADIGRPEGFDWSKVLTPAGVKAHIESLPVADQRRMIRSVISKVVLTKAKGAPRDRLVIEFVDGSVSPVKHNVYDSDMNVVGEVVPPSIEEMEASDDPFWKKVAWSTRSP
jgi:DNA invertase Pin-like site-specific DNA recombinase